MKVHEDCSELHKDQSLYYVPEIECLRNVSDSTIATKLKAICCVTKDLVSEAYELQRRKATEILAFVISDTDRIHDGEHPNQIPIAYALKGYSPSTEKLREMIDVVRNKCKSEGIDVLCKSTDGQWARNCMRSKEGKPLTCIQYQRDVWNKFCRNSKVVLLETLMGYSKVDADCLNQLQNIQFPRNLTFEMGNI